MSSINSSTDYSNLANQLKLNNANALFGSTSDTKVGALNGDLINQWQMLRANSAAYKKMLQAQQTGNIKQNKHYNDLLSDKLFNDYYDTSTGKVTNATYKPDTSSTATIDKDATVADNLESMRRLALAAINGNTTLSFTHYNLFESLRQTIANNLVASGSGNESPTVTVKEALPATIEKNVGDFRLLTEQQNFTISGANGEKIYNFAVGDSLDSVVSAINADTAETGVTASLAKGSDGNYAITLESSDTGKGSFVKIVQNVGTLFCEAGSASTANGADAVTQKTDTVTTGDQTMAAIAVGTFGGAMFGDQSFTIEGARGSKDYSFASGTSVESVVSAINANSSKSGIMAEVIYNDMGEAEGIGIMADKAGAGQFVKITQNSGDLFASAGKSVKVTGSGSTGSDGPAIASLHDLGKVSIDGVTYSFADLGPGGSATLAKNPDAALAVLDQALKDIYEGRAQIKGFDPADQPLVSQPGAQTTSSTNTLEIGNYGSNAITQWLSRYIKEAVE